MVRKCTLVINNTYSDFLSRYKRSITEVRRFLLRLIDTTSERVRVSIVRGESDTLAIALHLNSDKDVNALGTG